MKLEREPTREEYRGAIDVLRKADSITLNELAEQFGKKPSTFYNFYNGIYKKAPSSEVLRLISKGYGFRDDQSFKRFCIDLKFSGALAIRHCMEIGNTQTLWWRAIGTGERHHEVERENIKCVVRMNENIDFQSAELKTRIAHIREDHRKGLLNFDNNELLALRDLVSTSPDDPPILLRSVDNWPPRGADEKRYLGLYLERSDYASFYAVARDDEGRSISRRILRDWSPKDGPNPVALESTLQ